MAEQYASERQRLEAHYRELSNDDLLELSAKPEELSDDAQVILPFELKRRGLVARLAVASPGAPPREAQFEEHEVFDEDGLAWLTDFMDGHALALACDALAEAELAFKVKPPPVGLDASQPQFYELWLEPDDLEEARTLLRSKLGLFPLHEVAGAPRYIPTGEWVTLGEFEQKEEAEQAVSLLRAQRIAHAMRQEMDEDGVSTYTVEVRDADLERGVAIVAETLGIE
jgi:hypothetical protein